MLSPITKTINFGYVRISALPNKCSLAGKDPDDVVLRPNKQYSLRLDMSKHESWYKEFNTGVTGMTKLELAKLICSEYIRVYDLAMNKGNYAGISIKNLLLIEAYLHGEDGVITVCGETLI